MGLKFGKSSLSSEDFFSFGVRAPCLNFSIIDLLKIHQWRVSDGFSEGLSVNLINFPIADFLTRKVGWTFYHVTTEGLWQQGLNSTVVSRDGTVLRELFSSVDQRARLPPLLPREL